MSDIIMSDIVIGYKNIPVFSERIWADRSKNGVASTSLLDIRMTLSLPITLYREWAVVFVSRGGGA